MTEKVVPTLYLTRRARMMLRYASEHDKNLEVSGIGRLSLTTGGDFWVDDIIIPPQEVGAGSTDVTPETLGQLMAILAERDEHLTDWRLWWHSHGTMGTFTSSTDLDTLNSFAEEVDWAVGLVTNARGDYHAWIEAIRPFSLVEEIPVRLPIDADSEVQTEVEKAMEEVKKFVAVKTAHATPWLGGCGRSGEEIQAAMQGAIGHVGDDGPTYPSHHEAAHASAVGNIKAPYDPIAAAMWDILGPDEREAILKEAGRPHAFIHLSWDKLARPVQYSLEKVMNDETKLPAALGITFDPTLEAYVVKDARTAAIALNSGFLPVFIIGQGDVVVSERTFDAEKGGCNKVADNGKERRGRKRGKLNGP